MPIPAVSRRQLLRAGGIAMAIPWLESPAFGGGSEPPRRLVHVCTSFGLYGPAFFPATAGRGYAPSEYLTLLDGLREHFTVFSGISHPDIGGDHASEACFLTSAKHPTKAGFRNTVSLDFLAAQHMAGATRLPLLTLTTLDGSPLTYTTSGASVPALGKPSALFSKLFLAGSQAEIDREVARLKEGRSLMDGMWSRFKEIGRKTGARDRQQLADYAEAVRSLEQQLQSDESWAKRPKPKVDAPAPSENYPSPFADRSDSIGRAKVMLDMIRLALKTDSTRVASLFIRGMDEKPPVEGVGEGHHGLSHHGRNPAKIAQLKLIEQREIEVFRDFLTSLKDTPDGDGTLLDHTQVLIGSNLGDASSHSTTNLPILLAGGGHRHGQHIAGDAGKNTPLSNLFVSMLRKFGMEVDAFGSSTGAIAELS